MRERKMVCILMIGIIFITGCWDKVEIDKRAFIAIICIDKFEEEEEKDKNEGQTKKPIDQERNRYTVTIAYPNTGVIAGKQQGEPKFVYTSVGKNFHDILDNLSTRLGRKMHFRHTKAIVIGERLAEDEKLFREVVDTIERSPEIGRKVNVMITPGKAKKIIETSTKDENVLGLFIRELVEQNLGTARLADADFGYILRSLHESRVAITPRIFSSKDEFKIAGAAVLKDFKMVGYLGEEDTRNVMFMFDKVDSSVIHINADDLIMPIHITDSKTKKKVYEKDNNIYTSFYIQAEGDLVQHLFEVRNQPLDAQYIQKLEKIAAKSLEEQIKTTYKKIQKDFGTDLIQVGEYLRKHEPDVWKKVKGDWPQIFPKTKVDVHVEMKIRRIGVTQ